MPRAEPRTGRTPRLRALAALGSAAIFAGAAPAWSADASTPIAATSAEARQWLQRIHLAASQRNYQGTLVVSALGGGVSSSRLAHYGEGSQSFERIDALDGKPRRIYRHNDQMLTLWPATKVALVEQRESIALFPAVLSGSEDQLLERYDLVDEGVGRVAGLDARVFLLRPRDSQRFAQRLWAERVSGLLLRADVLAGDGRVLETAAFTEITLGVRPQPETVLLPMKHLDGYRVTRAATQRTVLEAEGWRLRQPVAGFRQVSCVKRKLDATGEGQVPSGPDVLQAIFSDGLTHVSIFIEPHRGDRQQAGMAATGATHTLMQALGSDWLTVVGDVPMATLKQFAGALERAR